MANSNDLEPEILGPSGDMAVVGEGSSQAEISVQVLQQAFHHLTGKTEEINKGYDDPILIEFDHIEKLHFKLQQTSEQYSIRASNLSVKVFYERDQKDTFSSFERFKLQQASSAKPVESVLLTYEFLIVPPKIKQAQKYTLTIRLASRVTILRNLEDGLAQFASMLKLTQARSAAVTVNYVDYAIARSLMNCVDEWIHTLPQSPKSRFWNLLRRKSHYVPLACRYGVGLTAAVALYLATPSIVMATAPLETLARFLIFSFCGIFAAYRLADHLGRLAERYIDGWSELSYVRLTAGDSAIISEASQRNRRSVIVACVSVGISIAEAILISLTCDWLLTQVFSSQIVTQ